MEKILADHIDGMGWETEDLDYHARLILTIIESHGMVPPHDGYVHVAPCSVNEKLSHWKWETE
jgi:hypothetical protein